MTCQTVLVQLRQSRARSWAAKARATEFDESLAPAIAGLRYDESYSLVQLPALVEQLRPISPRSGGDGWELDPRESQATFLARGRLDPNLAESIGEAVAVSPDILGVYLDPPVALAESRPDSPIIGSREDVEQLLQVPFLQQHDLTGVGVAVAIVNSGVCYERLARQQGCPALDVARSWPSALEVAPGASPCGPGTVAACDIGIAAPDATLIDVPVVPAASDRERCLATSDVIKAYCHLIELARSDVGVTGRYKSLVVANGWHLPDHLPGSLSFPTSRPAELRSHPLDVAIGVLSRCGADILFPALLSADSPATPRAPQIVPALPPTVLRKNLLRVGAVDTRESQFSWNATPHCASESSFTDIWGYSCFVSSGLYSDSRSATSVVAGLIAAVRAACPFHRHQPTTWPDALRNLLLATAARSLDADMRREIRVVQGRKFAEAALQIRGSGPGQNRTAATDFKPGRD